MVCKLGQKQLNVLWSPWQGRFFSLIAIAKFFFFTDFPTGCTTYVGPHSLQCYQSIWANVGCLDAGYKSPANLSDSENKVLNKLDLR